MADKRDIVQWTFEYIRDSFSGVDFNETTCVIQFTDDVDVKDCINDYLHNNEDFYECYDCEDLFCVIYDEDRVVRFNIEGIDIKFNMPCTIVKAVIID